MSDNSSIKALKAGVWYTVANFLTKGLSFIIMPIFTRIMTKADIGDISNFSSWLAILTSIISLDLYSSVSVAKFDYKDDLNPYISSILVLGSLSTAFFFAVSFPFRNNIMSLLSLNKLEYYLLFIIPMFSPALNILHIKSRLEYKYKLSVSLSLGNAVVCALCGVLCVLLFEDKLTGRLLGSYIPSLLLSMVIYSLFIIRSPHVNVEHWKYALMISLPLIIHVLSGQLLSSSDRVMITNMCGKEYNALYNVAYSTCMGISLIWGSMNTAWAPWAYEQMYKQDYQALKKASRPYLLLFGFIAFCFILVAPDILLLMGGSGYASAIDVIPPVTTAFIIQFVYSLYVNIETFCKKQKYIALASSVAAGLNIILNLIFIPRFGYIAAAYTTLAGYGVMLIMHFMVVRRSGKSFWYDTKFNFSFVAFFLVLMGVIQLLYANNIVRYSMIGVFLFLIIVVLVWMRKEVYVLLHERKFAPLVEKAKTLGAVTGSFASLWNKTKKR